MGLCNSDGKRRVNDLNNSICSSLSSWDEDPVSNSSLKEPSQVALVSETPQGSDSLSVIPVGGMSNKNVSGDIGISQLIFSSDSTLEKSLFSRKTSTVQNLSTCTFFHKATTKFGAPVTKVTSQLYFGC